MRLSKRMRLLTLLPQLLCITSVASILSCCENPPLPTTIHDEPLWLIKGSPLDSSTYPNYAVGEHFLTAGQTDYDYDSFNGLIDMASLAGDPMIMMHLSSFEDFNTEIAKLCSNAPCTYQQLRQIISTLTERIRATAIQ